MLAINYVFDLVLCCKIVYKKRRKTNVTRHKD